MGNVGIDIKRSSLTQPDDSQGRPHGSRQQRRTKRIIEDLQGKGTLSGIVEQQMMLSAKLGAALKAPTIPGPAGPAGPAGNMVFSGLAVISADMTWPSGRGIATPE